MNSIIINVVLFFISINLVLAQKEVPILKTTVNKLSIKEDNQLTTNNWTVNLSLNPDIYTTHKLNSTVSFYSDIDSIRFVVKKGVKYDFIVLLNGTDSAFTEIVYEQAYIETLRNASKYNTLEKREIPNFTYQDSSNENLIKLRQGFNLDSIAGSANEISKILNLMHWIHNLVPHDGVHGNPQVKNAMNMISVCQKTGIGLNCRGLATVLNECYLSMGFKSRFVTCLPKDSLGIDSDCHVINMVFSETLNKWIYIDPTHDLYVMNEKGELLGIEEVRERLINNKPLIINPDANWNHKQSTKVEYYLNEYMAKNLYMLKCPLHSEFDTETREKGKTIEFIELIPIDYFKQKPIVETYIDKGETVFKTYKTNVPTIFWEKPINE